MGPEKLDNTVYLIRGLYDLADMAKAKSDSATEKWAAGLAGKLRAPLRRDLVERGLDPVRGLAQQPRQRADPAEALDRGHADGGRADDRRRCRSGPRLRGARARRARRARERLLQRHPPVQPRALPHRLRRRPEGRGRADDLLADDLDRGRRRGQLRPLGKESSAATRRERGGDVLRAGDQEPPDEQPGALPEILPSPDFGDTTTDDKNIDRCWTCRAMFMQAWGHYGTAWPVIHQQLGVRPALGHRQARDRAAAARGPAAHRRHGDPARRRQGRRPRRAQGPALHDDGHRRRVDGQRPARRRDAAGGRGGRHGHARRRAREEADGARDQPRRRGHGARAHSGTHTVDRDDAAS